MFHIGGVVQAFPLDKPVNKASHKSGCNPRKRSVVGLCLNDKCYIGYSSALTGMCIAFQKIIFVRDWTFRTVPEASKVAAKGLTYIAALGMLYLWV